MKVKVGSTKLKGTVLFTVVSVLMVLIVFLMGTLALAATASNRAYSSYQKEQTEYTARAVLDSVVKAINEDTGATNGLKWQMAHNLQTTSSTPLKVTVTGTDGLNAEVTIANVETRSVYSENQGKWVTGTVYEVSTTFDKLMAGTTYSAYIVDEHVAGPVAPSSGGGGAFVSLGGVKGSIGTKGFTSGGTEIGIGTDGKGTYEFQNDAVQMVPFFVHGNLYTNAGGTMHFNKLGKNQFMAVTGDLTLNNTFNLEYANPFPWTDGKAVAYNEIPCIYVGGVLRSISNTMNLGVEPVAGNKGIPIQVYCGSIETQIHVNVYGDFYAFDEEATSSIRGNEGSTKLYKWASKNIGGRTESGTTSFGNFYSAGNVQIEGGNYIPEIASDMRVAGDLTLTTSMAKTMAVAGDVVCGGVMTVGPGFTLNCNDVYADILIVDGKIESTGGKINARYIVGAGEITGATGITSLNTAPGAEMRIWYEDVLLNNTSYINSKPTYDWQGKVTGSTDYEYVYYEYAATRKIKVGASVMDKSIMGQSAKRSVNAWAAYDPTTEALYQQLSNNRSEAAALVYIDNLNTNGIARDNKDAGDTVEKKYGKPVYPAEYTGAEIEKNIVIVPSETQYSKYPTTLEMLASDTTLPITLLKPDGSLTLNTYDNSGAPINQSCILDGNYNGGGDLVIDATGSSIVLIVDNFSVPSGKNIIIKGKGKVIFFIRDSFHMLGGDIITEDIKKFFDNNDAGNNTTVTYDPANPSANFNDSNTDNVENYTEEQATATSPLYPNVFIHSAVGAKFQSDNNHLVTANVRAPKLTYTQSNGILPKFDINYIQQTPEGPVTRLFPGTLNNPGKAKNIGVIGQLICQEINVSNEWGMIFVTLPTGSGGCNCCSKCTGGSGCTCIADGCTCAGCACKPVGSPGIKVPEKFAVMYYNYY